MKDPEVHTEIVLVLRITRGRMAISKSCPFFGQKRCEGRRFEGEGEEFDMLFCWAVSKAHRNTICGVFAEPHVDGLRRA